MQLKNYGSQKKERQVKTAGLELAQKELNVIHADV